MGSKTSNWEPDQQLLKGKVALIAGGGQGIGKTTSELLARAGAAVAVLDYDPDSAEAVAREVTANGGEARAVVTDLRDEQACKAAIDRTVAELGGLNILANVAGGMSRHAKWRPLHEWTTDVWDSIVHLNLRYVFWLCREAVLAMRAGGGGTIVNVGSIAGSFGCPNQAPYGAAKAGLINLTKTLALECGAAGIRVNAVSPGVTLTEAAVENMKEETRTATLQVTPLHRLGRTDDIARALLFFASPLSEFVTGQELLVDGGVSVNFPYSAIGH
jgi:7-alpha-hydroxysteroid dehydrogenase